MIDFLPAAWQKQSENEMAGMAQIAMQRIVTEWLRHDSLWEVRHCGEPYAVILNRS